MARLSVEMKIPFALRLRPLLPPLLAALAILRSAPAPVDAFRVPAATASARRAELSSGFSSPRSASAGGGVASSFRGALSSTAAGEDDVDPYASPSLDAAALAKYAASAATELALFGAAFRLLDLASAQFLDGQIPFPAAAFVFYAASLKSRAFNPLNNRRPDLDEAVKGGSSTGFRDRVMPSWTPPGVVFPIMWILIIGPLRAYSAALVVSSTGDFLSWPIMAFILHLTCGDVWNTINNTEKRYGAAVVGVLFVVLSAANAAYQYSQVDPLAGKLLGATLLWLVTAAALITDTWRLNPTEGGEKVPLYPVKGEAETSFIWFD